MSLLFKNKVQALVCTPGKSLKVLGMHLILTLPEYFAISHGIKLKARVRYFL